MKGMVNLTSSTKVGTPSAPLPTVGADAEARSAVTERGQPPGARAAARLSPPPGAAALAAGASFCTLPLAPRRREEIAARASGLAFLGRRSTVVMSREDEEQARAPGGLDAIRSTPSMLFADVPMWQSDARGKSPVAGSLPFCLLHRSTARKEASEQTDIKQDAHGRWR